MKIEVIALCDAATDNAGKLNILGTFDTIHTQKTPAVHPSCAVAARIRFEKVEEGEHPFRLAIIDQDGATVAGPIEGKIAVRTPAGLDSSTFNLILNFQGLEVKKYGANRLDLSIDNQIVATVPLYVRAIPQK